MVDLLKAEEFRRYVARPELLRQGIEAGTPDTGRQIVIDEIQKVPALLDEVHWLLANRGLHFTLCGSSARKVRRGAANLLGGRAVRYELHGLTATELGGDFDLDRMLNHGYLPRIYAASRPNSWSGSGREISSEFGMEREAGAECYWQRSLFPRGMRLPSTNTRDTGFQMAGV